MTLDTLLPLTILLVLLGLIILLMMWSKRGNKKYLSTKRIHWILGSYLTILLVATVIYVIIPKEDRVHSEHITKTNIPHLADLVYEGKSLDAAQMYMKNRWEFEYEQNQLEIFGHYEEYSDFNVLISIERKEEDDGIVEVAHYQTPIIMEGLDVTKFIDPIQFDLTSAGLEISGQKRIDVRLRTYRNDFSVRQFTGENWWQDLDYIFDREVLSLRIPKSMQVIDANGYFDIHYVQE